MIKLEIYWINEDYPRYVYMDEETLSVDHCYEDMPLEQLNQAIALIQKAINSICDMKFSICQYNTFKWADGQNNYVSLARGQSDYDYVAIEVVYGISDWAKFFATGKKWVLTRCRMSYDDFKKLLVAQNKKNEIAYLLLQGVIDL